MASFSDPPAAAPPGLPVRVRLRSTADLVRARIPENRTLLAAAVAFPLVALAFARFGAGGRFVVASFVIGTLCVLSAIDIAERRLPNRIVLPSAAAVLLAQIALYPDQALEWVAASLGASLALFVLHLVYPSGLGLGDVKLALLLGAALGADVLNGLLLGSIAAAVYAAVILVRGGPAARKTAFALGPFLAFGAIVVLLA